MYYMETIVYTDDTEDLAHCHTTTSLELNDCCSSLIEQLF